jgi:hypothetical protein
MALPDTPACSYCDVLTAWSTFAEAVLIAIGAAFAVWQVRAANAARRLQAAFAIFQHLENPEFRRGRWFIHNHMAEVEKVLEGPFYQKQSLINKRIRELSEGSVDLHNLNLFVHMLEDLAFLLVRDDDLFNLLIPNMLVNMFLADGVRLAKFIAYRQRPENRTGLIDSPSLYACHIVLLTEEIKKTGGVKRVGLRAVRGRLSRLRDFLITLDQVGEARERLSIMEELERLKHDVQVLKQAVKDTTPQQ